MKKLTILLLMFILNVSNGFGQLGADGTGTVNGYEIGIGVTLGGVNFSNADLSGAMLWKARMQKVNFDGANLSGAVLKSVNFRFRMASSSLRNTNLSNADLSFADLEGCDLSGADLRGADLSGTSFYNANLSGADLSGVKNADFGNALLIGTIYDSPDPRAEEIELLKEQLDGANSIITEKDQEIARLSNGVLTEEIKLLNEQLAEANSTIAEKNQEIEKLSNGGLTLEQVQDGRLGSIVLTPIPNTQTAILSLDIEQSEDLKTWTLYRKILESIAMPDGKKFYRFALDK